MIVVVIYIVVILFHQQLAQTTDSFIDDDNNNDHQLRYAYPFDVFITPQLYFSCEEAWLSGFKSAGIYPIALTTPIDVVQRWMFVICNNDPIKSSTVILYREYGVEPFARQFDEYVNGFGSAKTDYFIGLENIRNLTEHGIYCNTMQCNQLTIGLNVLTIRVKDANDTIRQIQYRSFKLKGAPDYEFDVSSSGVGDLPDDFWFHRNLPFRALGNIDRRNDSFSCVDKLQVGWWYRTNDNCAVVLLTGQFVRNRILCHSRKPYPICDGVYWADWTGFRQIKHVTMELSKD